MRALILILMAVSGGAMAETQYERESRERTRDTLEMIQGAMRSNAEAMRSFQRWEPPRSEIYDPAPMRWREPPPTSRYLPTVTCTRYPSGLLVCM